MNKFLYFQDGHAKGKNSINRLGNYFEDWLIKFDELLSIAKSEKVDAIIDGGDLFDAPIVSYSVCDAIVDRIEKTKIKYYCLFGNHAERYHSKEHSFDTTLAHVLRRSKYFEYLEAIAGKDFIISGFDYSHNIEEEIKEKGIEFTNRGENKTWNVAIVHAFICPEKFPYASHVICDDIKTNADLVLVAHYHKAWQKKIGNTEYLDIGCFGRNSITEASIIPKVVILDTDKREYQVIPLKSAKAGTLVFNLEKAQDEKNKQADLELFIQSLESISFQGQSIEGIINNLAKENNIPSEVTTLIHNKIQEVS